MGLKCRSPGQYRWRVAGEQVSGLADEELIGEVLGDAREEVVDHRHVTLGLLHFLLSVQHNLRSRGTGQRIQHLRASTRKNVVLPCACSYRSGEVDGHQRVRGQEEVIESQGVFELRQHVAEPRDEPGQGKDGSHLRPGRTGDSRKISGTVVGMGSNRDEKKMGKGATIAELLREGWSLLRPHFWAYLSPGTCTSHARLADASTATFRSFSPNPTLPHHEVVEFRIHLLQDRHQVV